MNMDILNAVCHFLLCWIQALSMKTCGIDNGPVSRVYEGQADIGNYPWLGILYYPINKKRFTTAVVLVTRQIVLASAIEIERLPKKDFRARARVVLGRNCSGPYIKIRDYAHHPDYPSVTFSTLTMIQLETDFMDLSVRPICPPPAYFKNPRFFAMVLSNDCRKSTIMIHKMEYISQKACKLFYRRNNLDVESLWPTHTACARSMTGGKCVWRSGAILVIRTVNRWRLLGFGVYGPGCQTPSRFLDYGKYHKWVERSISRIGRPSMSILSDNHVVLRRMTANIQRFGPCDEEETVRELYSDADIIEVTGHKEGGFSYNVSLCENVDYSCITIKADQKSSTTKKIPKLKIQRWCAGPTGVCYGFGLLSIHFRITVDFKEDFRFTLRSYGQETKLVDPMRAIEYINAKMESPNVLSLDLVRTRMKNKNFRSSTYFKGMVS